MVKIIQASTFEVFRQFNNFALERITSKGILQNSCLFIFVCEVVKPFLYLSCAGKVNGARNILNMIRGQTILHHILTGTDAGAHFGA